MGSLVLDPRAARAAVLLRVSKPTSSGAGAASITSSAAGGGSAGAGAASVAVVSGGAAAGGAAGGARGLAFTAAGDDDYVATPIYASTYEEVAIEYAASCIEYHNTEQRADGVALWAQLEKVLQRVSAPFVPALDHRAKALPCWASRLSWWPATYFAPRLDPGTAVSSSDVDVGVKLRAHIRACAKLICGANVARNV